MHVSLTKERGSSRKKTLSAASSFVLIALLVVWAVVLVAPSSLVAGVRVANAQSAPAAMDISITTGNLHFPGENAVFAFTTSVNGSLVTPSTIAATLYLPNNANSIPLTPAAVTLGVYNVNYTLPADADYGFYTLVVTATYTSGSVTYTGVGVSGFEISQGMANNQNEILSSIDALSNQLSTMESNILETFYMQVGSLNSSIGAVSTSLAALSSSITPMNSSIGAQMSALSTQLANAQSSIHSDVNGTGASIQTLSNSLQSFETNTHSWLNSGNASVLNFEYSILAAVIVVLVISIVVLFFARPTTKKATSSS